MAPDRCPREDPLGRMNPGNVVEVKCPSCGEEVEFIADEKQLRCRECGEMVANPNLAPDGAK